MTNTYPAESYTAANAYHLQDGNGNWINAIRHVFVWEAKPFTVNEANQSRWKWMAARKEWRDSFELMASGCQPLASCDITVDHLVATRRNVDVAACLPSFKAALDGIVLAGVLADDDATRVLSVTFRAPVYVKGRDALIVSLVGPLA